MIFVVYFANVAALYSWDSRLRYMYGWPTIWPLNSLKFESNRAIEFSIYNFLLMFRCNRMLISYRFGAIWRQVSTWYLEQFSTSRHLIQILQSTMIYYSPTFSDHHSHSAPLGQPEVLWWRMSDLNTMSLVTTTRWLQYMYAPTYYERVSEWTEFIVALTILESHSDLNKVRHARWLDLRIRSCM